MNFFFITYANLNPLDRKTEYGLNGYVRYDNWISDVQPSRSLWFVPTDWNDPQLAVETAS